MASLKLAMVVDANNPNVGDLYLQNGTDRLTQTLAEEVQQLLYTRFRFFQGEWFLDPTAGVPYFQSILGIKVPLSIVAQIFRQVIITCPGVAALTSFALVAASSRGVKLTFACTLADGTTLTSDSFAPFVIGALIFGGT